MIPLLLAPLLATQAAAQAGVVASGPNGPTNPEKPEFYAVGSTVNQTSIARLITANSIDDFCMYAPMEPGPDSTIGNTEHNVVAWCTKPRNNARLIPDGTIKSAQWIKTPEYIQISGWWDGSKLNIPAGDDGGELDPHGPTGEGNPVGGNVTTNAVDGKDVFYEEWMSFVSVRQFCLRICTANGNVSTALMCEHELDVMGCNFVMAIPHDADTKDFTSCDGDVAAPPGLYPKPEGGYSTFRQRFTGTWDGGVHTIGNTVTPSAPAFYPKTSNCKTYQTIGNGIDTRDFKVTATPSLFAEGATPPPVKSTDSSATDSSKPDTTAKPDASKNSMTPLPDQTTRPGGSTDPAAPGTGEPQSPDNQGTNDNSGPNSGVPLQYSMSIVAVLGAVAGGALIFL